MPVCLFDIDGTLLSSGGAGQAAMEFALELTFGITGPTEGVSYAGRTDRAITADMLQYHNVEATVDVVAGFIEAYLARLPQELELRQGLVLPGVPELLERLSHCPGMRLALLTGNFRRGAELKLTHYGLMRYFQCGGFGDHYRQRDDVARQAVAEVCSTFGPGAAEELWVIGDTPADVQCGRAIGAMTVAVATGVFSAEELQAATPDHLFEDFSDVARVMQILAGETKNPAS